MSPSVQWLNFAGGCRCHHCRRVVDEVGECRHRVRLCDRCLFADPCAVCEQECRAAWIDEICLDTYEPKEPA